MESLDILLKPQFIWFLVGLILLLLEFINPGIVIIFFGIGAWIVAFVCLFIDISINLQLSLFLIISILLLLSLRRWFKNLFEDRLYSSEDEAETMEGFFGKQAIVTKEITPRKRGKVEFRGSFWDAESDETILEGASVEIINKNNITLTVKTL